MSLSSGELLKRAFELKCNAGSQFNWMLATKRIPISSLDYIISNLERSLEYVKELRERAK